ncbi:phosphatase [Actinoplanes sp. NBRC 14428]|uniref:Serine phosphatase RsbU (Regulator of sigma subunit) n=1 Tax=Pseudosporangium ferrugineum TaxID=439699 RepID=A0A2T0S2Q0_9ACTN|nr:PP2C family protein-serine/threonine phosphatase [Pseudosporangium ferrugineum]PRY27701.1 serine phosphatase RsbU (regulator of sigma subunit) [Pseudosporangium ferrugineum]BCJ55528.1 phosphatase [Actinoplanes sp. NBRC 14428]
MSDRPTPVSASLRAAPPDRLPEVVAEHLRRHHAAGRIEVLLGDLTLTGLQPLLDPDGPGGNALAQRCFGSQRPVVDIAPDANRAYLPLHVWGERLGVLVVETTLPAGTRLTEELTAVADDLAVALQAAAPLTDRYRRAVRLARLTMAAELQWELLPGRSLGDDRFLVAGQLEPAYAVFGDHFDWTLSGERLTVTVLNGHGDGLEAALLTTVAVNAMRNARRSGANIVEQAELASDAVYARYGGAAHAATLLLEIDLVGGRVEAVDAGSPRAMIARDRDIRTVALEQQLPLGMFGETRYETQRFRLEPADRLLVVSDGVHAASPGGRTPYGESALLSALRRTRLQPATEAVGTVMRGLREYHAGAEPDDDAVTVCLDWRR